MNICSIMESAKTFIKRKKAGLGKKPARMKDIGRKGWHYWLTEAATFMVQHNLPEKVFVLERLKRISIEGKVVHTSAKVGDIEYRIGYFMVGKIGRMKGRWTWGQYCPLIPKKDFKSLFRLAEKEKTIL